MSIFSWINLLSLIDSVIVKRQKRIKRGECGIDFRESLGTLSGMKRDNDLIRAVLDTVEQRPAGQIVNLKAGEFVEEFPGLSDEALDEHIHLLVESGFLEASRSRAGWIIKRLTMDGHDFLEMSKVESVWQKAKQIAGNFAFVLFVSTLKDLIAAYLKSLSSSS